MINDEIKEYLRSIFKDTPKDDKEFPTDDLPDNTIDESNKGRRVFTNGVILYLYSNNNYIIPNNKGRYKEAYADLAYIYLT